MKLVIIFFIIAMALTCGYPQPLPTYPKRVGFMNLVQLNWGVQRTEQPIPDFQMIDGYRQQKMMTGVKDIDGCCPGEFPLQQLQ